MIIHHKNEFIEFGDETNFEIIQKSFGVDSQDFFTFLSPIAPDDVVSMIDNDSPAGNALERDVGGRNSQEFELKSVQFKLLQVSVRSIVTKLDSIIVKYPTKNAIFVLNYVCKNHGKILSESTLQYLIENLIDCDVNSPTLPLKENDLNKKIKNNNDLRKNRSCTIIESKLNKELDESVLRAFIEYVISQKQESDLLDCSSYQIMEILTCQLTNNKYALFRLITEIAHTLQKTKDLILKTLIMQYFNQMFDLKMEWYFYTKIHFINNHTYDILNQENPLTNLITEIRRYIENIRKIYQTQLGIKGKSNLEELYQTIEDVIGIPKLKWTSYGITDHISIIELEKLGLISQLIGQSVFESGKSNFDQVLCK